MAYEIRTFEDLLQVLRSEPQWREELRRLILTDELLKLPEQFQAFQEKVEKRFDRLESDLAELKRDVAILKEDVENLKVDVANLKVDVENLKADVAQLKIDVEKLKVDVEKLKVDVADLKGDNFERKVRERAPAYLGRIIRKCRVIDISTLAEKLEEAQDSGIITEEEKNSALNLDLLAEGFLKDDRERKVLVAVEVSIKADKKDVERVKERSKTIEKVFGLAVIPIVIGKTFTKGAKNKAKELEVVLA